MSESISTPKTHIEDQEIPVKIKFLDDKINHSLEYSHMGDACADIRSNQELILKPGKFKLVKTGIAIAIPFGFEGQVRPRSGLALKHGIFVLNSPGTIDSSYRGELGVILANFGPKEFVVNEGDRIGQLKISRVEPVRFTVVDELEETNRGTDGFGSTGIK